jgi:hypothetical protein
MDEYRKEKIIPVILLFTGIVILLFFDQHYIEIPVKCLHKEIMGFGCPLCGFCHAINYFFRFQYKEAFTSNPAVFLFVLYVFAEFTAFIYPNVSFIKIRKIAIYVMLAGLMVVYLLRCIKLL